MSDFATALRAAAETALAAERKQGGIKDLADGRQDIYRINPYLVRVETGWNVRDLAAPENREHVETLARSIAAVGVKEPLTVYWRDGAPVLTDGHCRLAATMHAIEVLGAEIKTIPVKTEDRHASEADRLARQFTEGKPKSLLEQAAGFARLMGFGWTEADIAKTTGMSVSAVQQRLELNAVPAEVKAMVKAGDVSATLARLTVREDGATAATDKLREAVKAAAMTGKAKVTKRTLAPPPPAETQVPQIKPDALADVATILQAADVSEGMGGFVRLGMDGASYRRLRALLGIEVAS